MPIRTYGLLDVLKVLNGDSTPFVEPNASELTSQLITVGETLKVQPTSWQEQAYVPYPFLVADQDGPTGFWLLSDPVGATSAFDSNPYLVGGKWPMALQAGAVTFGVAGPFSGASAANFDGTAAYFRAASFPMPAAGAAYSFEAWVKQASTTGDQDILSMGQGTSGTSYLHLSAGVPMFDACVAAGTATRITSSGGALTVGTWHHIVGTYDGSNMRLYVDGALVAGPTAIATGAGNGGIYIGGAGSTYWNGSLYGCAFYPVALSAQQVANHYAWGTSSAVTNDATYGQTTSSPYRTAILADSPLAWWRQNDPSGNFLDSSGNGRTGTAAAGPSLLYRQGGATHDGDFSTRRTLSGLHLTAPSSSWASLTAAFSLECWLKMDSFPLADYAYQIFQKGSTGANAPGGTANNYSLYLFSGSSGAPGVVTLYGSPGGTWSNVSRGSTPIPVGTWVHIVATWDGTFAIVYVNGVGTTPNSAAALPANTDDLIINMGLGAIDEVAIYGTALSAARVQSHYNAGLQLGLGARYGLFKYPNPPNRSGSNRWGSAVWGSFTWG